MNSFMVMRGGLQLSDFTIISAKRTFLYVLPHGSLELPRFRDSSPNLILIPPIEAPIEPLLPSNLFPIRIN